MKSQAIRDAARGEQCTMRLVDICCNDNETTVLAHLRSIGTGGISLKPSDLCAVFACARCHDFIDGRYRPRGVPPVDLDWYMARAVAHARTPSRARNSDRPKGEAVNETRPVFKLIIGIDPGATGALAFLADGRFDQVIDMPTVARKAGGEEINGATLAALLRGARAQHPGAHVLAVLEAVSAMPGQGVSGMFRFGESAGCIRGVLQGVGIPFIRVQPLTWKKHSGVAVAGTSKLSGPEKSAAQRAAKDLARARAIELYPEAAAELARKKDVGRADALLMARWAHATDQIARAA